MPAPGASPFSFDDAPIFTSLPVALSSNGLGAYLDGGFYNYAIQHANAYGFTPLGFDGRSIYPNSVFQQDLTIDFDLPIVDFSILYGADEIGCDDTSVMRATAYLDEVQVATNTAMVPVPGTYPTGTLSVTEPGGFNRVVIHYDRAPIRCQDYGRIFWLDNMMAIRPIASCPSCAADYDNNGGVDGGDLAAFFADFEFGEPCADVDGNGGVDGGDLGYFFTVFEAGGCQDRPISDVDHALGPGRGRFRMRSRKIRYPRTDRSEAVRLKNLAKSDGPDARKIKEQRIL